MSNVKCTEDLTPSEAVDRNNQGKVDELDAVILELNRAVNNLLAARIAVQREKYPVTIWHDLKHMKELASGLRISCEQTLTAIRRECGHTGQIFPAEHVRA